jgi:hypothetical protein
MSTIPAADESAPDQLPGEDVLDDALQDDPFRPVEHPHWAPVTPEEAASGMNADGTDAVDGWDPVEAPGA